MEHLCCVYGLRLGILLYGSLIFLYSSLPTVQWNSRGPFWDQAIEIHLHPLIFSHLKLILKVKSGCPIYVLPSGDRFTFSWHLPAAVERPEADLDAD